MEIYHLRFRETLFQELIIKNGEISKNAVAVYKMSQYEIYHVS